MLTDDLRNLIGTVRNWRSRPMGPSAVELARMHSALADVAVRAAALERQPVADIYADAPEATELAREVVHYGPVVIRGPWGARTDTPTPPEAVA